MGATSLASIFLILAVSLPAKAKLHCKHLPIELPKDWITVTDPCTKIMANQVQEELQAAMTYMAMGAHFSRDTINRVGFSEFFFKAASEEREHAMKIMEYLLMRGGLTQEVSKLIRNPQPVWTTWDSGLKALKDALSLEARVTTKIRDIISVCESPTADERGVVFNDYHLVDYLTSDFLTEQYEGQRQLAGMISTLGKMTDAHGEIGEFLFDKKLLKNEV